MVAQAELNSNSKSLKYLVFFVSFYVIYYYYYYYVMKQISIDRPSDVISVPCGSICVCVCMCVCVCVCMCVYVL